LAQKRKAVCVESALDRANAKALRAADAVESQAEHKRQETLGDSRRVEVGKANQEGFTARNKSNALNAERTGILACIKYWAQGSAQKVFELVMAIMTTFGLKERVADELGVEVAGTNAAIVTRLHDSVQILKACSSEEQRQQYRVLLTAAAPEKAQRTDSTGMGNKFADALQVNRKSVPYLDSIAKRAEIDDAAKIQKREIAVGDQVACKHGTGTLAEYSGPDGPCAVKMCLGDVEHISRFDRAKKGPGGGSIRHATISFAHKPRSERKDRIQDHVKKQVQTHYESHCAVSPCAKHKMRKRLGVGCYITAQMMILLTTMAALYSSFETAHRANSPAPRPIKLVLPIESESVILSACW
jgi:hypothetical protein